MSAIPDSPAIDVRTSLGELVTERAARARILERHGIDYCCHGQRSLAEAADAAGVDVETLVAEMAAADVTDDDAVAQRSVPDLIAHILSAHHTYLHDELPALEELATKVASVHGGRHVELADVERLVRAVRDDLEPHLETEETEVFPVILRHVAADEAAPDDLVERLRGDHEATGALLAELRRVSRDFEVPGDGCASYQALYARLADLEADTFRHIHLENNVLFPAVAGQR